MSNKKSNKKQQGFEETIKKVEDIASSLEDSDLPLQERFQKFEEGIALLKDCEKQLKDIDLSIKQVIEKSGKLDFKSID